MTLELVLAWLGGITSGAVAALAFPLVRRLRRPRPVNVVDGIVLPMPDDPRWTETPARSSIRLGAVAVDSNPSRYSSQVWAGPASICSPAAYRYAKAVGDAYLARKALESIENT